MSEEQLQDLDNYQTSTAYSELEKLVLRFAEEWTRQTKVSGELMQALAQQLTPPQLITLAATVAMAAWTNKFSESFGIELP